jgi:hypothetical protein
MTSTKRELINLVEGYFSAVDSGSVSDVLEYLAPGAIFTIATFNVSFSGRDSEIQQMFERLKARYRSVWHGDFSHVVGDGGMIASQFRVVNETHERVKIQKYNSNFFTVKNNVFSEVVVYMSGENSLE